MRGMDASQWAIDLKLAPADRRRLEDLVRNGNTPQKLVPRARIALLSDGTRLNGAIAREVGPALPTMHRWQRRVQEQGVDGLLRGKTRPSRIGRQGPLYADPAQRPHPPDGQRTDPDAVGRLTPWISRCLRSMRWRGARHSWLR